MSPSERTNPANAGSLRSSAANPVRILGIDPGLNRTGYALLDRTPAAPRLVEGGVIRSNPSDSLADRVHEIAGGIREILREHQPSVLAIEQVFSLVKNPKTAVLMAHARGAILFVASHESVPIVHYTPTQIKRLLTGSGHATKDQIQRAIMRELSLTSPLEPNDVADAFAVALGHYYSARSFSLPG